MDEKKLDKVEMIVAPPWELRHLHPTPAEEWDRLRGFLALGPADIQAMLTTVEPLFRRGHELVVDNYAYLQQNPETAAILGWESGADPQHLAERRRFFTVWLARTLGMDFSHDFAGYLFRAGQIHAGHGPRHINRAACLYHRRDQPDERRICTRAAGRNARRYPVSRSTGRLE